MCFKNVGKGKAKETDNVETVISSLPFLKPTKSSKQTAEDTFFCVYMSELIECIRKCCILYHMW